MLKLYFVQINCRGHCQSGLDFQQRNDSHCSAARDGNGSDVVVSEFMM